MIVTMIILEELMMAFPINYYWAKIDYLLIIEFIFMLSLEIQITFIVIMVIKKISQIFAILDC